MLKSGTKLGEELNGQGQEDERPRALHRTGQACWVNLTRPESSRRSRGGASRQASTTVGLRDKHLTPPLLLTCLCARSKTSTLVPHRIARCLCLGFGAASAARVPTPARPGC